MKRSWTVQELLTWTKDYFTSQKIAEPRLEAEVLLASALGIDRLGLYVNHDRPVNEDERAEYREFVRRRAKGEPTAYITKFREFMSLPFYVDERVLVPRPDTETLVEESVRLLKIFGNPTTAADIGTGSGAIAVSIAKYSPETQVYAVDISESALEVARQNAAANGVDSHIVFLHGSLLEPLSGKKLDLLAANLPYIRSAEMPTLPEEVRDYEPHGALVGGDDGLDWYRQLLPQALAALVEGGYLLMEIGDSEQAEDLIRGAGSGWLDSYVLADLAGRARVVVLKKGDMV